MSAGPVQTCLSCGRPVALTERLCNDCRSAAGVVVINPQAAASALAGDGRDGAASRRSRRATGSTTATSPALARSAHAGVDLLGETFSGVRPAGPGQRLAAFAVDSLVVVTAAVVALALTRSALIAVLVLAEVVVGVTVWEARTGRTFGNLLLGLRAARREAPFALGPPRAASRALVVLAGSAVAGVGQWFVVGSTAFDRTPLRQGWHDRVGRAVVVDVRAPRAPVTASDPEGAAGRRQPAAPGPATAATPTTSSTRVPTSPVPASPAPALPVPALPASAQIAPAAPIAAVPGTPGHPSVASPPEAVTSARGIRAPGASAAGPGPGAYILTLDDGRWAEVRGPGVVGRAPQVPAGEPCDHVVTIDDPTRSVSRTHARFGVGPAGFWVQDAGSGNGTIVVLRDGRAVVAPPDARTPVPAGATVRLGNRTFTVAGVHGAS